jgi:hypothetical protein
MATKSWVKNEQKEFAAFKERERLARIAAAAPDLLAACEALVGVYEGQDDVPLYVIRARKAIAKAQG